MLPIDEIFKTLKTASLFKSIDDDDLMGLAYRTKVREFEAGEKIFDQGGKENEAYMVYLGHVGIYRNGLKMASFWKREVFGEFSMLDGSQYSAAAEAEEFSMLLSISREDFFGQMKESESMTHRVIQLLCRRLKRHLV